MATSSSSGVGMRGRADDTTLAGPSSRQSFLEHVHSVLSAPLPECLQLANTSTDGSNGRGNGLRPADNAYLLRLLGISPGGRAASRRRERPNGLNVSAASDHHHRGASPLVSSRRSGSQPPKPFYERLLEEGRLAAERQEQRVMRAVMEETADMRPAPTLPPDYKAKPLPPDGQRIEDRLLQRAREHADAMEKKRLEAQRRRDEEMQQTITFRPTISPRAQQVLPKYRRTPADFEAWRARRKEELEAARAARLAAEESGHTATPEINPRSERLANQRKRREAQAASQNIATPTSARRSRSHPRGSAVPEAHATPILSEYAARLEREGDVAERLYAEAAAQAQRRAAREQHSRDATPFRPNITAKAAASTPRFHLSSSLTSASQGDDREGGAAPPRSARQPPAASPTFRPTTNPVSDAIARQLPESSQDRLLRPRRSHSRSTAPTAPYPNDQAYDDSFAECDTQTSDLGEQHGGGDEHRTVAPLPPHIADAFAYYEERRKQRLHELRRAQEAAEQATCTFAPRVNSAPRTEDNDNVAAATHSDSVVTRNERWLEARERRLALLREQRQREEAAEAARCARWREEMGLHADRPRPSRASTPHRDTHYPSTTQQSSHRGDSARPPNLHNIYESVYHADPTSRSYRDQ